MATILLVEDDIFMRSLFRGYFTKGFDRKHKVYAAETLPLALKLFAARNIDLVCTDLSFPSEGIRATRRGGAGFMRGLNTSGRTLIETIWSVNPDMKSILITGSVHLVTEFLDKNRNNPNFSYINKLDATIDVVESTVNRMLPVPADGVPHGFDYSKNNLKLG